MLGQVMILTSDSEVCLRILQPKTLSQGARAFMTDATYPRSGFCRAIVAPWYIKWREEEREHDLEVMAEQFAAHAHITNTLDDRVYATLHFPHDEPAWHERSPS
eukprot:1112799-Prymnesium_polylepis.1